MSPGAPKKKYAIISSSILNKFNEWPYERLLDFVCKVDSGVVSKGSENDIALFDDVKVQLECFEKIETDWSKRDLSFDFLVSVNALVTGEERGNALFRSEEYVRDFGGETPTNVDDIPTGISAIKQILSRLNSRDYEGQEDLLATDMAEAFCTIINVHPFADGNGRTARFLIQLVLLKEGFEYLELPKYRNNEDWRHALDMGTKNDFTAAAAFLLSRLKRA